QDGTIIPGLSVRKNGFALGSAYLQYNDVLNFGSIMKLTGVKAGVSDFNITFGSALDFDGEIFIGADSAILFPNGSINFSITDGPDAGTEAVRAALTFTDGVPDGFKFQADQFTFKFASVITIFGSNIYINTNATAEEIVASFTSLGASISAGPLQVGGEMRSFGFMGDGSFFTMPGFGVYVDVSALTGSSIGWPSWMPIRITEIGIQWPDINKDPGDFTLILSAAVTGLYNLPFEFSGAVDGIKIDLGLLAEGKFPIIDIAGIAVSIKGNVFGGQLSGALIGGILKLDANGNMIPALDTTTVVADRVFYMGVEGGFMIPGIGGGFLIRFALSELGPLGVFITASVPGGVLLEPFTGLSINDFSAGVNFFKSLPSITDPTQLRSIIFPSSTSYTADMWLESVKSQVVAQYKAIMANPNQAG
ncbi:MAG: hypothetical protein AAGU05_13100, partial [Anaerolineaceae bacterium]